MKNNTFVKFESFYYYCISRLSWQLCPFKTTSLNKYKPNRNGGRGDTAQNDL